jgi:hypothetical protein
MAEFEGYFSEKDARKLADVINGSSFSKLGLTFSPELVGRHDDEHPYAVCFNGNEKAVEVLGQPLISNLMEKYSGNKIKYTPAGSVLAEGNVNNIAVKDFDDTTLKKDMTDFSIKETQQILKNVKRTAHNTLIKRLKTSGLEPVPAASYNHYLNQRVKN